jgi:hypothetical protein
VGLVVVLAVAAVVLDVLARSAAEKATARQVKASTEAGSVSVTFNSEPFLWDVLADGKLDQVTVVANDVPLGPLTVTKVEVQGSHVHFDRNQLFNSRTVRVTSISKATVTITAHVNALGALAIQAIDFTRIPLVPNCPLASHQIAGGYELTCTVAPVPQSVIDSINSSA